MNKRLRELAKNALMQSMTHDGVYRPEGYENSFSKQFADKFAELIVRECICEIHAADVGDLKGKSYYLDKVAEHIEKHFGVE